ncbi:histidine kinase [Bacillus coahuilensis]|uniref:sensor histidine kinase n=1 Tax=Bacillus coahuilensis TaxID=408580 RepID=UPI000185136F|nr:histidine kinase [Bacillus coahuilensis]
MKSSIRRKMIFYLIVFTIIPLGMSMTITYFYTKNSVTNSFIQSSETLVQKGAEDIQHYLETITSIPFQLYTLRDFANVLTLGVEKNIDKSQLEIDRSLDNLYYSRDEIEQIHLYIENGQDSYSIYNYKLSSRGKLEELTKQPYYLRLKLATGLQTIIEPTHPIYSYNNRSTIDKNVKTPVLSFHQRLMDVPSNQFLGIVSIDITLKELMIIVERLYNEDTEDYYLLTTDGQMITTSVDDVESVDWLDTILEQEENHIHWSDEEFKGIMVYETFKVASDEWILIKRIPYYELHKDAREISYINLLILFFSLLIVEVGTLFISFKMTAPIKVLIQNMKRVEKGEFKVDFLSLGDDEFGELGHHFTSMVETIDELFVREYLLELRNKTNQLKVLQSQVNPHFLNNALQSIGTSSLKQGDQETYQLLMSLSKIMRYSMNNIEDFVTLREELEHSKAYLHLQKQRFKDRFTFDISVDDDILLSQVPKMTIQPIIENYFKHGLEQDERKGHLTISCKKWENKKWISIQDNGKGMNEQEIENLMVSLHSYNATEQENGIGLKNIYDRIKIYYGIDAEFKVEQNTTGGITVNIIVPISIEEESL